MYCRKLFAKRSGGVSFVHAWLLTVMSTLLVVQTPALANPFSPRPQPTPEAGVDGASTLHGDTASSDTSPFPGPGRGALKRDKTFLGGACPTLLQRSDGHFMVLCTSLLTRAPVVHLMDAASGKSLGSYTVEAGELLSGVYAYIDNEDRIVMVDGQQKLLRITATPDPSARKGWRLTSSSIVSLRDELDEFCSLAGAAPGCDGIVSLSPGASNKIWFASRAAVVGIVDTENLTVEGIQLSPNEQIHNSFSTTADGRAAVVTDHSLYLLSDDAGSLPQIIWRHAYDRGPGRKPGQLSHGSGATPTFFGPQTGTEYVTITDNADKQIALLVRDATLSGGGDLICSTPLFAPGRSGTENSAIGIGRSIFVASTYGYPYPAPAVADAGAPVEDTTYFSGGMVRVDINENNLGCEVIWTNNLRSAAVPKLSTADGLIYTVTRRSPRINEKTTAFDAFFFTVIDANNGNVINGLRIGHGFFGDTLQTAGNISQEGGVFWQGRMGGITRIYSK